MSRTQSLLFSCLTSPVHSTCTPTSLLWTWWPLRSARWPTLWPIDRTEHTYSLWAQRSHWNEQYRRHTDVLPQIEHDIDLWFSWEHCDSTSWVGFGRRAITEYVDITTVLTGEREVSAGRSRVYHFYRENSASSSSHFRENAGSSATVFSHRRKSSQESLSDREVVSLAHRAFRGENEAPSRLSESEDDTRLIIEE